MKDQWLKRVDSVGAKFWYHSSDMGTKTYIYYTPLAGTSGQYYVKKGNMDSRMKQLHWITSKHETLQGAMAAVLVTLVTL